MNTKKPLAKRRKWKRYRTKVGAIVLIKKHRLIEVGKPRLIELGPLIDISMGGLAVQYIKNKQRAAESEALAISMPTESLAVEPIPFKTISDIEMAHMPDGKMIRNRCVEFGALNDYQAFQLKTFIQHNTVENSNDRRSGADRRQYQDPRFQQQEYREIYDRRLNPDRRDT